MSLLSNAVKASTEPNPYPTPQANVAPSKRTAHHAQKAKQNSNSKLSEEPLKSSTLTVSKAVERKNDGHSDLAARNGGKVSCYTS
jgi:hypothetical protein